MHMYSMTENELQKQINEAFEVAIHTLADINVLTKEQREEILGHYAVVITCKGWFGKTFDKLIRKKDDTSYTISLVKTLATEGMKDE